MSSRTAVAALALAALAPSRGEAQDEPLFEISNAPSYSQSATESAARQAWADNNFDAIMLPQNEAFENRDATEISSVTLNAPAAAEPLAAGAAAPESYSSPYGPPSAPGGDRDPEAEVPLDRYEDVRGRLDEARRRATLLQGPTVTLGASEYEGRAIHGALELTLRLEVTLGAPDDWKTVPLVGDDVVLVRAAVDGKPVPVSRRNGYHVWVTRRSGEITVTLDLLVPSRGPRGSLEYDFLVARTPITRFRCRFPSFGLEPRLDAAVQSEVRPDGEGTILEATLRPTTRIHLIGFRDMGEDEESAARVFAESLNLLSVEESALETFSVIRYTILYSGAKRFDIEIPAGMTVVSADGEGAFRFSLEEEGDATVLRGETAFPIRNGYEVSLRLRRQLDRDAGSFDAPLPRCRGVEREHGWLAVEVPGKLKLGEEERIEAAAVDVRQLPEEIVRSAVSPVLKAYRYHSDTAAVRLSAIRLPEKEPSSGSVDRIRAFSVVSAEGTVLTDMRIQMRNRLQPALALDLPDGSEVLSAHLDGEAIRPSRDEEGRLVLPLKRSAGQGQLEQFTLQVVLEGAVGDLGLVGSSDLALPAVDLPVSTVSWTVYLPANNAYSRLCGDVEPQVFASRAHWTSPLHSAAPIRVAADLLAPDADTGSGPGSAGSGQMAVRIDLPESGIRLDYSRFWVEEGQPVEVSFFHMRGWLLYPAGILLALLLAAGTALLGERGRRSLPWVGIGTIAISAWPVWKIGGAELVIAAIVLGALAVAARRGALRSVPAAISEWAGGMGARFSARERGEGRVTAWFVVSKCLAGSGLLVFGLILLVVIAEFVALLANPL